MLQGSHSHWKTWKNERSFSSQGILYESGQSQGKLDQKIKKYQAVKLSPGGSFIPLCSPGAVYARRRIRTAPFKHGAVYARRRIHVVPYTHGTIYTRRRIHAAPYTHGTIYTWHCICMELYMHGAVYAWSHICMEPYTHGAVYAWSHILVVPAHSPCCQLAPLAP